MIRNLRRTFQYTKFWWTTARRRFFRTGLTSDVGSQMLGPWFWFLMVLEADIYKFLSQNKPEEAKHYVAQLFRFSEKMNSISKPLWTYLDGQLRTKYQNLQLNLNFHRQLCIGSVHWNSLHFHRQKMLRDCQWRELRIHPACWDPSSFGQSPFQIRALLCPDCRSFAQTRSPRKQDYSERRAAFKRHHRPGFGPIPWILLSPCKNMAADSFGIWVFGKNRE